MISRMGPRGRIRAGVWAVVAASGLAWGCGKPGSETPRQDCSDATCPGSAPAPDWRSSAPTFHANVQVVDPAGAPIWAATVRSGKVTGSTDTKGFARIGPLPASKPQPLTVEKAGWTPRPGQTTAFESGQQMAHVVLIPVGVKETIAPSERIRFGHQGAVIELPPKALRAANGTLPTSGKVELTQLSPGEVSPASMPATHVARDEFGGPAVMKELLSATFVHFTDAAGQDLHVAAGQTALMELPIPEGASVTAGQEVAMWTLDESDNTWRKERTCTIETRQVGSRTETVCRGSVAHFSWWAIAEEYDIFKPNALGCVNATLKEEADACYTTLIESEVVLSCNASGESCNPVSSAYEGFYTPDGTIGLSYCSVVTPGKYRIELTYRVDASKCKGEDAPLSGRRVLVSPPLDPKSFAGMLGQSLMLNFTLNGSRDCPTLCAQVELPIDKAALAAPSWSDRDGDGTWVTDVKDAKPPRGSLADCDDGDRFVHPGAPEPFCATKDMNCDQVAPKAVKALTEVPFYKWNWDCRSCKTTPAFEALTSAEKDGNEYDEDCDGRVGDRDLDGVSAPEDCNDWDAKVAPGKDEVPGNHADEDCDDIALDADNDGFPSRAHAWAAEELSAKFPKYTPDKFVDCDDQDGRTNPSVPVSAEVGQMKAFYYTAANGDVHRHFSYCSMFRQDGTPSWYFYQVIRDRNCDGKLTDIDGDGFTDPSDTKLGADKALDCDELDPRVGAGQMSVDPEPMLVCQAPDHAKLINDSICTVKIQPYEPGVSCPVLSLSGTTLTTACQEIKNADMTGTGEGVCGFDGWSDSNPLSVHPGEFFGPCDGDPGPNTKMPCAEGLTCGGLASGAHWTPEFETYIRDTYLEGAELRFRGMCFPACKIQ